MKTVALFLLLCAPVLADEESCKQAYLDKAYDIAVKECSPLAQQGNAYAQENLGEMYEFGNGVPQDYFKAVSWYRKAADQGLKNAQYILGTMYNFGKGVAQDYHEAARWFRLAADQGDMTSQIYLGNMYDRGQGVPQDYVLAHMWFNLASASGFPSAKNRDDVAKKMTPAQIAEAQRLAREWKPKAGR